MSRSHRVVQAGHVYHVLNRACERRAIFTKPCEYGALLRLFELGCVRVPLRILAYCIMPNHWHLLVWPAADRAISAYLHWVTTLHSLQYRRSNGAVGYGHVYQDRFHCFPIETTAYYFQAMRYIEANALRSGLVIRAEDWPWSSAFERSHGQNLTVPGPLPLPTDWLTFVNQRPEIDELTNLRTSVGTDRPYGSIDWAVRTAITHNVGHKLRPPGRPPLCGTPFENWKMRLK